MKFRTLGLILVLIAVLALVGCQNPFSKEKPEEVIAGMLAKLSSLESVSFKTIITSIQDTSGDTTNLKIEGQSNFANQENSAATITVDLAMKSDQDFNLTGSAIFMESDLYLKLDQLSEPEQVEALGIELNKWYAISSEIMEMGQLFGYQSFVEDAEQSAELTDQQKQELKLLISNANLIKVDQALEEETVAGQECYHYRISVDQIAADQFFTDLLVIIGDSESNTLGISATGLIEDYFSEQKDRTYEVWIDKDSHWLTRVATKTVTMNDIIQTKTDSSLILELSEHNQQFNISAPTEAEEYDFTQLYSSMFLGMQGLESQELDLEKDTDQDGLADYVESVYQTDPENPDTDGDGFSDGEELEHGYNPLGEGGIDSDY